MKILYHHRTNAADGGGVHIESLIQALRELDIEVVPVVPFAQASSTGTAARPSWTSVLRRSLPHALHELAELAYNVPEAWRLWRAVRTHRPDLIYERANLFLLSGSWVARHTGTPLISEVNSPYVRERSAHGRLAWPRLAAWAESKAWRSADAVVAVTGVLANIVAEAGVARDRVHVMSNGIDGRVFSRTAVDPAAKQRLGLSDYIVLGFTGYVRDWNGLNAAVDLLASPGGEQLYLLIVGNGPARAALEARAQRLGVAARLRFTGVVARSNVASYVSAFDVALQPAANPYASPLKLFEYMAMARAIVAPNQANICEILADGRDAILFEPANTNSFAAAVMRLVSDPSLRARIADGAAETVRRRDLTWRRNAECVRELTQRLAAIANRPITAGGET